MQTQALHQRVDRLRQEAAEPARIPSVQPEQDQALVAIKELIEVGDYSRAVQELNDLLDENPRNVGALFLLGSIMIKQDRRGLAYNIYARVCKLAPDSPEAWVNYSRCQDDTEEGWEGTKWCLDKALELRPNYLPAMGNLSSLGVQMCRPDDTKYWAYKCLDVNPTYDVALTSLSIAQLMTGEWEKGWKNYALMLGHRARPDVAYGDVPLWEGEKGKTVIVYGEQGIGDEILFSSVLPDMAKENTVILDCMPRLKRLFTRSFPDVHVVADRWSNEIVIPEGLQVDARMPMAGIPIYYRQKASDFPGKPYLKSDPQIDIQMRALLDSLGDKPKIGIAWTGGTKRSRCHFRQRKLEEFINLITDDCTWISLQYKDCQQEISDFERISGVKVHHFDWITEAKEMDLTASLVNELDLVIAVPTSVTQLAGGLGKEVWVMVPEITGWLFYPKNYLWADTVKLFHNKPVKLMADYLKDWMKKREHSKL